MNISGIEELEETFRALPNSTRNRAGRPALREGAKIVRAAAEGNIKAIATQGYATGTLEKNIRVYNFKDLRGAARVGVTIRRGAVNVKKLIKGEPVRVGLYAAVLEYGKERQPPRSWIRKAARENVAKVVQVVIKEISQRMADAVAKAKR